MNSARQLSLIITIIFWSMIMGGIVYAHIVYFPPYLHNLPESNNLLQGPYGLQDGNFWMFVHPFVILSTIVTLILNWKNKNRKKLILTSTIIYAAVIIATSTYFLPELFSFAASTAENSDKTDLLARSQKWEYLSWFRGAAMYFGFVLLLLGLAKPNNNN